MFEKKYSLPNTEYIRRPPKSGAREAEDFPIGSPVRDLLRQFLPKGEQVSLTENFAVSRDRELEYTRFVRGQGDDVEFEFLISDEANGILHDLGKVKTKKEIKGEINKIADDPYGDKSIDPLVNKSDVIRNLRSVNTFGFELEKKLGIPIAVKGSARMDFEDLDREDLIAQFRFMKQRGKEWSKMPENIKKIISVCNVYAAFRYKVPDSRRYEEWLIMERVPNAKQVESYTVKRGSRFAGRGFKIDEDPLLAKVVESLEFLKDHKIQALSKEDRIEKGEFYTWEILQTALKSAGLNLSDVAGRNILYSEDDPQKRHYVLIDQRDRSKEGLGLSEAEAIV